ncbi:MAG: extracellular solute-binding protein [Desulfobacterales bacterium]
MKRLLTLATLALMGLAINLQAAEPLKLLTWKGYAPQELIDKFEQETGMKVEVTFTNNEEMIAKLRATRGAGFDLAQPSQDRISAVQAEFKIYQPMDYSKIDSDQIIASMLDAVKRNTKVGEDSYGVPFCYGTSGLIVNTRLAPEAKDYTALLDKAYAGRISYRLKRPTLIALAFAGGDDPFAKYDDPVAYKALMDSVAAKMIAAKPYVKNYWSNGDSLLEMVRSGEVIVAMGWDNGGWKLHAENPDIDFVAPTSGALGWIDTFAIPAKAKNIEGAYKWINFMLRPENAALFSNQEKYATASKGAGKYLDDEVRNNIGRSFTVEDIDNIKWYPPVSAEIEQLEGKILDKVKAAK